MTVQESAAVSPTVPGLEFAFQIRAQIGETRTGGQSPKGERLHIEITGGTVQGPMLTGAIMPGGSDWPLIRTDGTSEISARYSIIASDSTPVLVCNKGLRVSSPEIMARLRAGEAVDPSEFYFRSSPRFEAPEGPHGWLNDSIFVASLCRDRADILIDVFRVT